MQRVTATTSKHAPGCAPEWQHVTLLQLGLLIYGIFKLVQKMHTIYLPSVFFFPLVRLSAFMLFSLRASDTVDFVCSWLGAKACGVHTLGNKRLNSVYRLQDL